MALVSKKDFAIALGVPYGTIRSKFSRKQLCCNRKGLIDTENSKNYIYLLEINGGDQSVFESFRLDSNSKTNVDKKSIAATKTIKKVSVSTKKVVSGNEKQIVSAKEENENASDNKGSVNIVPSVDKKVKIKKEINENQTKLSLEEKRELQEQKKTNALLAQYDLRKKEAEVSLVERNAELKQWELEKKAGNTLPLDMIEKVVAVNYKAVFKSIHSQIKNVAMVLVQQLGGSKDDLNAIMIELENILDTTVKDSQKKASVDIEKLIDEYSEIRSRGERKV